MHTDICISLKWWLMNYIDFQKWKEIMILSLKCWRTSSAPGRSSPARGPTLRRWGSPPWCAGRWIPDPCSEARLWPSCRWCSWDIREITWWYLLLVFSTVYHRPPGKANVPRAAPHKIPHSTEFYEILSLFAGSSFHSLPDMIQSDGLFRFVYRKTSIWYK